jgi:tetratricopeptide (TPR) repeat protein
LEIAETENALVWVVVIKGAISSHYRIRGKIDLAYQFSAQIVNQALDHDEQTKGTAYGEYGSSCFTKGMFDEAEENLIKGITFHEKAGYYMMVIFYSFDLGEIYLMKREYQKAQSFFEKAILYSQQLKSPSMLFLSEIGVAKCRVLSGQDTDISKLLDRFNRIKISFLKSYASNYLGEIFLNIDDQDMLKAEEWIKKAVEINTQNSTRFMLGRSYQIYSEYFKRQNNLTKAQEQMNEAIKIMRECGADGWVEKYEKKLAEL